MTGIVLYILCIPSSRRRGSGSMIPLVAGGHRLEFTWHGPAPRRAGPRVRGLLLEAPHVFCEESTVHAIEQARDEYLRGGLRTRLERYHGGNVDCAFWGWNRARLGPRVRSWETRG